MFGVLARSLSHATRPNLLHGLSLGRVEATPLGRPLAQELPKPLSQVGNERPADVLAALTLTGVNVLARARVDLTNIAATQALDRERLHLPDESAVFRPRIVPRSRESRQSVEYFG